MSEKPKSIVIKAGPILVNLSPFGFHRYAKEFMSADESFDAGDKFSPVPYYLVCRSIELSLKAFLLLRNVEKDKLKQKIGHNLNKALRKAKELNIQEFLSIFSEDEENINKANKYYERKGFEYFFVVDAVTGYKDLPDLEMLRSLSTRLVNELYEPCLHA
jgi:hypothetical protein